MEGITIKWDSNDIKPISWNTLYSQKHWTYRKKLKDSWRNFFTERLLKHDKLFCEEFEIVFTVNSRADIDNLGIMCKFFVDSLNNLSWIKDDSPKHYKKFTVKVDKENLIFNSFEITYKSI